MLVRINISEYMATKNMITRETPEIKEAVLGEVGLVSFVLKEGLLVRGGVESSMFEFFLFFFFDLYSSSQFESKNSEIHKNSQHDHEMVYF